MSETKDSRHSAEEESPSKERPFWKRSGLWKREAEIRKLIGDGYSYEQVKRLLGLQVTSRWLCDFCVKQLGIRSHGGSGQSREIGAGGTGQVNESAQPKRRGRPPGKRAEQPGEQQTAPAPAPSHEPKKIDLRQLGRPLKQNI